MTFSISKQFTLALCICIVVLNSGTRAQEKNNVRLSSFIGDTLDLSEREMYHLFPEMGGFQWATFSLQRDSMLSVYVSMVSREYAGVQLFDRYIRLSDLLRAIRLKEDEFLSGSKDGSVLHLQILEGKSLDGTLLAVRDSTLLIALDDSGDKRVQVVQRKEIRWCLFQGHSNVFRGMGLGVLSGIGVAAVFGLGGDGKGAYNDQGSRTLLIGLITVPAGLIVGTIIGASTSINERVIDPEDTHLLKLLSKYPVAEPDTLKDVR